VTDAGVLFPEGGPLGGTGDDRAADHLAMQSCSDETLFVAGCAPNQGRFRSEFDHVVLLTAPVQVALERLATRTTNPFGKHPDERARILADKADTSPCSARTPISSSRRPSRSRRR
jgi:hypothetical protein